MKKLIAVVMASLMLAATCCGCTQKKDIVFPEDELLTEYTSCADKDMTVVSETDRIKKVNFYRGEEEIYTEIFVPEGDKTYPVVVITVGLETPHFDCQAMAQTLSDNNIIGVIYDPSDSENRTALSTAADIESVVEGVAKLSYVDTDNIFLWGYDIGGISTAYVGFRNPDLIRGVILAEPSLQLNKEIYDYMPDYNRNVIILEGNSIPSIGRNNPEAYARADELLPSCDLIQIPGATHTFEGSEFNSVVSHTIDFVNENLTLSYYW